jgi:hypothetical protein
VIRGLPRWVWLVPVVTAGTLAVLAPSFGQMQAQPAETTTQATAAQAAAQGQCLAAPAVMRRTHPDLLRHERRVTVHDGVRDPRARLENCVTCHAVRDAAGTAVSFQDPRHFCQTCHVQAAVSIDCFSCHRSTPATPVVAGGPS